MEDTEHRYALDDATMIVCTYALNAERLVQTLKTRYGERSQVADFVKHRPPEVRQVAYRKTRGYVACSQADY